MRLAAIALQRCPRCRRGPLFAGVLRMHTHCPVCGLQFEREPGYFTGAMIISYAIGVPLLALMSVLVLWITRWEVLWALAAADVLFVAVVPIVFRYSRAVWIHLDQAIDPDAG